MDGGLFRYFLFFVAVSLIDFRSFSAAMLGQFGNPKSIKMRLMRFCVLLILYVFFHHFYVLGGPMVVLYQFFFASFLAFIFARFGGRFGGKFGMLWGVQVGHFGCLVVYDFWMSFQERPQSAQECPKRGQESPQSGPTLKSCPRTCFRSHPSRCFSHRLLS